MAITTNREVLLEYIRTTTLPLINGTGNYNLEASAISRNFRIPSELDNHDFPIIFILDDFPTNYAQTTANQYTTGTDISDITNGMTIALMGYVKTGREMGFSKTGEISKESNKLHSDMVVAMHSDRSLGGNCLSVSLLSSVNSLEFAESDVGVVIQTYGIKYDFNPTGNSPST